MVESLAIGELQYVIGQGATTICDLPFPQNVEPNDHLSFLTIWDVLWICYSNLQVLRWANAAAEKVVPRPSTFCQSLVKRSALSSLAAGWMWNAAFHATASHVPGQGQGCEGAEKGQAVTPLTALAGPGSALLTEPFSRAEGWHGVAMPFPPCLQNWALSSLLLPPLPLNWRKRVSFWNFWSKMFPESCLFLIPPWKHIMLSISEHEWRRKAQCWIKATFGKR